MRAKQKTRREEHTEKQGKRDRERRGGGGVVGAWSLSQRNHRKLSSGFRESRDLRSVETVTAEGAERSKVA